MFPFVFILCLPFLQNVRLLACIQRDKVERINLKALFCA